MLENLGIRRFVCPECMDAFTVEQARWFDGRGREVLGRPPDLTRWERFRKRAAQMAPPEPRPPADDQVGLSRADAPTSPDGEVVQFAASGKDGALTGGDRVRLRELEARAHCPNGHLLPPDFDKRPTIVIALVGEPGSGKSQAIGVVTWAVRRGKGLGPYELVAELAPASQAQYTDTYWRWLFSGAPHPGQGTAAVRDGQTEPVMDTRPRPVPLTPPSTPQNSRPRRPIILVLRHRVSGRSVNVMLYDVSGEDQGSEASQARYTKFLMLADGLWLFVPPWALESLRPHIAPSGDVTGQSMQGTETVLDALAGNLREARRLADDDELRDVPTVLLLSKADQVRHVDGFRDEWLEPLDGEQLGLDGLLQRIEDETGQLSDFFARYGEEAFVEKVALRYGGIRIQALSATGCSVDATGHYAGINPMRVVEPLLYILSSVPEGKRLLDGRAR